jgi:arylsulfatase A-like enzyme
MKKKPNILLLYSDQHNARVLGCYGNKQVHTPNLDQLSREGVMFTNAYTQNPICTPSRMCIMSGQYPHNFGYYGLMGKKPENLPHLFSHVKRFGYKTGMAGKLHVPSGWLSEYCDYVADGYGHELPLQPWNRHNILGHQGMINDEYSLYLYTKGLGDKRDDRSSPGFPTLEAAPSELPPDETIEAWAAERTISFMKESIKEDMPFCFWMTVPHPHTLYRPAQQFWDMYDEQELALPPNANNEFHHRHPYARPTQESFQNDPKWKALEPRDWESYRRRIMRGYYACVTQVDEAVGRVLQALDEMGIRENTIIVYTTDHGEFAGEHGMIEKAPGIGFRCVTRIPFIWSWKDHLPEAQIRDGITESVDFLPTVCSLAGLEPPNWVNGTDISPALHRSEDVKEYAFTETPTVKTIHSKQYKLTQYLPEMNGGEELGELYDLENDPWEMNNLYFERDYQDVVHWLRYELYCWLVRSTRNKTVNSSPPTKDWSGHREWDLADDLYDEDDKLGHDFVMKLINSGKPFFIKHI